MEKVIYAFKRSQLLEPSAIADMAKQVGARRVRVNLQDEAVAGGAQLIQSRGLELPDCVVQLWLQSSNIRYRAPLDEALRGISESLAAWLVSESTILENPAPAPAGERTAGFAQLAFLTLPEELDWKRWRQIWRDSHTQVAIDTQSNFEYRQNLVVENLLDESSGDAGDIVAIVEECFPAEALTDPLTFFAATGYPEEFRKNLDTMMESCARFITPGTIDVFPTSQYDFA